MNKIPTAEELYNDFYNEQEKNNTSDGAIWEYKGDIINMMKEFAKLHVQAALKSALEDSPYGSSTDTVSYIDMKNAILEAYPLENIK